MRDIPDRLEELIQSITEATTEDFIDGCDHWVVLLKGVIDDVEDVVEELDKKDERIVELQNQVDELEGYDDEDEHTIDIEVNGLPDQMKLEFIQTVFDQYSLEELEVLIPSKR